MPPMHNTLSTAQQTLSYAPQLPRGKGLGSVNHGQHFNLPAAPPSQPQGHGSYPSHSLTTGGPRQSPVPSWPHPHPHPSVQQQAGPADGRQLAAGSHGGRMPPPLVHPMQQGSSVGSSRSSAPAPPSHSAGRDRSLPQLPSREVRDSRERGGDGRDMRYRDDDRSHRISGGGLQASSGSSHFQPPPPGGFRGRHPDDQWRGPPPHGQREEQPRDHRREDHHHRSSHRHR